MLVNSECRDPRVTRVTAWSPQTAAPVPSSSYPFIGVTLRTLPRRLADKFHLQFAALLFCPPRSKVTTTACSECQPVTIIGLDNLTTNRLFMFHVKFRLYLCIFQRAQHYYTAISFSTFYSFISNNIVVSRTMVKTPSSRESATV